MTKQTQQNTDTLFTDDFMTFESDIRLEQEIQKFSKYDSYYVVSGCVKERREKFDALWKIFKSYADSHFLKQYKNNFHERTWEMYIGCVLLQNNLSIKPLDKGPDFIVSDKEYIECVACTLGDENKPDSVPEIFIAKTPEEIHVQNVPIDQMILRITSVIKDKHEKYKNCKTINKLKPYIVAINSGVFKHPQDYMGIPLVIKALFSLQFLQINQKGEKSFSWRQSTQKGNIQIPVNNFTNDSFKEISGIIFSDKDVLNHPEKIGDDCIFINNPNAINPVDINRYFFLKRWQAENYELTKLY